MLIDRNASIVDFPTRPIRKPYNASADQARMSVDYEDIFQSQSMYIPHKQDEYDIAMVAYSECKVFLYPIECCVLMIRPSDR